MIYRPQGGDVAKPNDGSVRDVGADLVRMVMAYAKQETVDPLRSLLRFVVWGLAGAVLLAIGGVLICLACVRALETELRPHLNGDLTWVPYCGAIVIALAAVGLAVSRIAKVPR
jgi:hypothetical protein